jgi:hypothetical protein
MKQVVVKLSVCKPRRICDSLDQYGPTKTVSLATGLLMFEMSGQRLGS